MWFHCIRENFPKSSLFTWDDAWWWCLFLEQPCYVICSVPCHQLSLWFNDPTERTVENDRRLKSIIVETLFLVFTPGIFAILSSQVTFPHMQLFGDSYIYFSSEKWNQWISCISPSTSCVYVINSTAESSYSRQAADVVGHRCCMLDLVSCWRKEKRLDNCCGTNPLHLKWEKG